MGESRSPRFPEEARRDRQTPTAEFVHRVLAQKASDIDSGWYYFWDPLAAGVVTDETLATFQEMLLTVVEEEGPQSGRTLVSNTGNPVRVANGADAARFERLFLETLNGRSP